MYKELAYLISSLKAKIMGCALSLKQNEYENLINAVSKAYAQLEAVERAAANPPTGAPLFTKRQMIDFAAYHSFEEYNDESLSDPSINLERWLTK